MARVAYNNPRFFDFVYDDFLCAAVDSHVAGSGVLFHSLTRESVWELFEITGVISELKKRGYDSLSLELSGVDDTYQKVTLSWQNEILVHLRLSIQEYRIRINDYYFKEKYLVINWLQTRHPKQKGKELTRLYPGQDVPGLGIFQEMSDLIGFLIISLRLNGAVIRPEYFHDAVLFSRKFHFLEPESKAMFLALKNAFPKHSIRAISTLLQSGKILDAKRGILEWKPIEMILFLEKTLNFFVFNRKFQKKVQKLASTYKLSLLEGAEDELGLNT
ncbi:histone deacetylase [Leptospira wolffii]|uniref:Histone deacetylase n=1 Tax=Leptospira wolffii TaxID=409998 RepID=A0A2M9Z982_9LEPT|nr:histone deacetylase [Leptospira wolffii]PJZ64996.1 histone deacetylase [Leptospira wolffii]TGK58101.1 histone deacetylase [Leptospira wolffii]TGK68780.1 histone deacetylase [Leptospira wolffii]TGK76380.1 histone deacetylase [Leptospira wolffii]TGL27132.1 histone deacetylase [Leptospira wolffii]